MLTFLAASAQDPAPAGIPLRLVAADGTERELRLVPGGAVADCARMAGATGGAPYLHIPCAPGQGVTLDLGTTPALQLEPRHFYRITAVLRRTARMKTNLAVLTAQPEATTDVLPPGDYLIAPVWEPVVGFYLSTEPVGPVAFRMQVSNRKEGLASAAVDMQSVEIADGGAQVRLRKPRTVMTWDRWELGNVLATLPHVPSQGAGIYRIRARVEAPGPAKVQLLLAQGDDSRLHWHRTYEIPASVDVSAGASDREWTYAIPDRRFIHQWIRRLCTGKGETAVLTNLVLEQLWAEPEDADALGLQTPKYR